MDFEELKFFIFMDEQERKQKEERDNDKIYSENKSSFEARESHTNAK